MSNCKLLDDPENIEILKNTSIDELLKDPESLEIILRDYSSIENFKEHVKKVISS